MKNLNEYKRRFNILMESEMGNVKPLIMEQPEEEMIDEPVKEDPEVYDFDTVQYLKEKLGKSYIYDSVIFNRKRFETLYKPNPDARPGVDPIDEAIFSIQHHMDDDSNHYLTLVHNNKVIYQNLKNTKESADKILNYVKSN